MLNREFFSLRRITVIAVLGAANGAIYLIPYLRGVYYDPIRQVFGLTDMQMGYLSSVYGVSAFISYLPGGWLADRVGPRILIPFSLVSTSISSFWLATFPSYNFLIFLHGLWGLTTILTFWSALVRATRILSPPEHQGKAFGMMHGFDAVSQMLISSLLLALFAHMGAGKLSLCVVINLISIILLVIGVISWIVIPSGTSEAADKSFTDFRSDWRDLVSCMRLPEIWLLSVIVLTAYGSWWCVTYIAPFGTTMLQLGPVLGGMLRVGTMWIRPAVNICTGMVADKTGVYRPAAFCLIIAAACFGLISIIPVSPDLRLILIVLAVIGSGAVFGINAINYAFLEACRLPRNITGKASSIVSVVGYTPDIFIPLLGGMTLNHFPGATGYRLIFGGFSCLACTGVLSVWLLYRLMHSDRDQQKQLIRNTVIDFD